MLIEFTCNGKLVAVEAPPDISLLALLRDYLDLTGTKEGCSVGECGACAVIMDGRLVNSCLVLAPQAGGSEIITIEGVHGEEGSSADGRLNDMQENFITYGAVQCGICIPGMVMAGEALLLSNPQPTRGEIRAALAGNLCRCTGYQQIVDAIEATAAGRRRPARRWWRMSELQYIGKPARRVDAVEKVTGRAKYVADRKLPGMLHARCLRSEVPHAANQSTSTSGPRWPCRASAQSSRARTTSSAGCTVSRSKTSTCWPTRRCAMSARRSPRSLPRPLTPRSRALKRSSANSSLCPACSTPSSPLRPTRRRSARTALTPNTRISWTR